MAQTRQDIDKGFSASLKGVKNEAFPVKILAFKIFSFIIGKIRYFYQIFKTNQVLSFLSMSGLCVINGTQ